VGVNIFKFPNDLRSAVSLVLGLTFTVGDLQAQEMGSPDQGLRIARALCAECHLVDKLPGQSPNLIAPTFEHIANIPEMISAALAALRTSHESMPNVIIKGSVEHERASIEQIANALRLNGGRRIKRQP
jgi:hypothetical protein